MIDTLKIARDIDEAGSGQRLAEAIAHAIGQITQDERLHRVEIATAVQAALSAVTVALLAAGIWQLVAVNRTLGGMEARLATIQAHAASAVPGR